MPVRCVLLIFILLAAVPGVRGQAPPPLPATRQQLLRTISAAGQAGHFQEAAAAARRGIALAQAHGHDSTRCVFSLFAGMAYYEQQQKDSALFFLSVASQLADAEKLLALQVRARLRLIDVYTQLDNPRNPALTALMNETEPLVRHLLNPRYTAGWEVAQGNYHNKRNETAQAVESFLRGLEIYRSLQDKSNEAVMLSNVGGELMTLRRWKDAITYNRQATAIFKELDREHLCISPLLNIGAAYEKLQQRDSAIFYYESSLHLAKRVGDQKNQAESQVRLARLLRQDSVHAEARAQAEDYLRESLALASANRGDYDGLVYGHLQKGEAVMQAGNRKEARVWFDKALQYARESQHKQLLRDAYRAQALMARAKGSAQEVYAALEKAYQYNDSIFDDQMARVAADLEARYQSERKQRQIEQLARDKELALLAQRQQRQQFIFFSTAAVLLLLVAAGIVIYKRNLTAREQMMNKERELAALNSRIAETRQIALRAQMNPHFIFNCMAAADGFILKNDRQRASELLTRFAKLVRQVLENSEHTLISMEQELATLEVFLSIEQIRFPKPFSYQISVPEELLDVKVPPLLFQPFVENALIHGLGPSSRNDLALSIEVAGSAERVTVRIRDNGIGRAAAAQHKLINPKSHQSMGTRITAERLQLLASSHGVSARVEINDLTDADGNVEGTEVVVDIARALAVSA